MPFVYIIHCIILSIITLEYATIYEKYWLKQYSGAWGWPSGTVPLEHSWGLEGQSLTPYKTNHLCNNNNNITVTPRCCLVHSMYIKSLGYMKNLLRVTNLHLWEQAPSMTFTQWRTPDIFQNLFPSLSHICSIIPWGHRRVTTFWEVQKFPGEGCKLGF